MKTIILLADDDSDDADMFCEALTEIDPDTIFHRAYDGVDVLEKLKAINEVQDMIFLDINMPRMDGWQCLSLLKSNDHYKSIPVMIYSTSGHQRDVDMALEYGAICYMTKPSQFRELKNILGAILANLHGNLAEAVRQFKDVKSNVIYFK